MHALLVLVNNGCQSRELATLAIEICFLLAEISITNTFSINIYMEIQWKKGPEAFRHIKLYLFLSMAKILRQLR